jgi:hypothetical protein
MATAAATTATTTEAKSGILLIPLMVSPHLHYFQCYDLCLSQLLQHRLLYLALTLFMFVFDSLQCRKLDPNHEIQGR